MNNTTTASQTTDNCLSYCLLKISGEDSASFLQGQLSNDIKELDSETENHWQYSAYCNQKGRVIALLKVWREEQTLYALINQDLAESTVDRLRKYVMRSKVEIQIRDNVRCFAIASKAILEHINPNLSNALNDRPKAVSSSDQQTALDIGPYYLLVDKSDSAGIDYIESTMSRENCLGGQINAGLPIVSLTSSELFIPQMLNLDLLGGINFKKGCYTGQEIVARMHYLGKLKQRMFICELIKGELSDAVQNGDSIYKDSDLNKAIGTTVSALPGSNKLLAIIKIAHLEDPLYINPTTHFKVAANQPYDIPRDSNTD